MARNGWVWTPRSVLAISPSPSDDGGLFAAASVEEHACFKSVMAVVSRLARGGVRQGRAPTAERPCSAAGVCAALLLPPFLHHGSSSRYLGARRCVAPGASVLELGLGRDLLVWWRRSFCSEFDLSEQARAVACRVEGAAPALGQAGWPKRLGHRVRGVGSVVLAEAGGGALARVAQWLRFGGSSAPELPCVLSGPAVLAVGWGDVALALPVSCCPLTSSSCAGSRERGPCRGALCGPLGQTISAVPVAALAAVRP